MSAFEEEVLPASKEKPRQLGVNESLLVSEFSVRKLVKILKDFDEEDLKRKRVVSEKRLFELSDKLRPLKKQNWELEQEIDIISKQIEKFLRFRFQMVEQEKKNKNKKGKKHKKGDEENVIVNRLFDGEKQTLFEEMFSLLLHKPKYLAKLAGKCSIDQIEMFVKTVLVDMYGGRPEFEAVMLQMFSIAMAEEFKKCRQQNDFGAIFRSRSAALTCLKEYALQGNGVEIINAMIVDPVEALVKLSPNLEVNMQKLYKAFIKDFEMHTGKPFPHEREGLMDQEIYEKGYIQKIYKPRIEQLKNVAETLFNCVHKNVQDLPWGVRWICKELAHLAKEYFPETTAYQRGGIVGGFIFLRLLNPRINMPDRFGVIQDKPKRVTSRTLSQATKILQKLSNGTDFKEVHFQPVNDYLHKKRETFQNFIYKITDVGGLELRMEMYELLKHKRGRKVTMQTSYNQILLMHNLLKTHIKEICGNDPNDPMMSVLFRLGPPVTMPYGESKPDINKYEKKDNRQVILFIKTPGGGLQDRSASESQFMTTASTELFSDTPRPEPLDMALQSMIHLAKEIDLKNFPENITKSHDFLRFLNTVITLKGPCAEQAQDCIYNIRAAVDFLRQEGHAGMDQKQLIISFSEQIRVYRSGIKRLSKHVNNVDLAHKAIERHLRFLNRKKMDYEDYFRNVKGGNANDINAGSDRNLDRLTEVKVSHVDLVKQGIVYKSSKLTQKNAKSITYTFRRVAHGEYEIDAAVKKMSFILFKDTVKVSIMDILLMEERNKNVWDMNEHVAVNLNLLKRFLNLKFQDFAIS